MVSESINDRAEAAALLGVSPDADAAQVRRAYRMWARVAHPDAGGNPAHFARLTQARRIMLRPPSRPLPANPAPRPPLTAMLRRPRRWPALVVLAGAALAVVPLALLGLSPAASAILDGGASAAWSAVASRSMMRSGADAGHRISLHTLTWLPIAAAQVAIATVLGIPVIEVLPLLALPFVAVIASINAGAGLWRPVSRPPA